MAHSVSEAAARAVKNSERKVVETRTPEEIIKTMRNNLTNPMAILKSDIAVLMVAYDNALFSASERAKDLMAATETILNLQAQVATLSALQSEIEAIRKVVAPAPLMPKVSKDFVEAHEFDRGGEA